MIDLGGSVLQTSPDVCGLQIGKVFKDLRFTGTAGKHFEHVFDTDAHPPDAWTSAALFGIKCDAIHVIHKDSLADVHGGGKPGLGCRFLWGGQ